MWSKNQKVEEFTALHHLINNGNFSKALALVKDGKADDQVLAIAPKQGKIGPGNSALHFLAFAGGKKDENAVVVKDLAKTLCQVCKPLLNHRNERGLMALHVAAANGNDIVARALLVARAGCIFTFVLILTLTPALYS